MTDLARLALLLSDQSARDEAPCVPVPVVPDELMLTRVGNIEYCDADNYDEDGSYTRSYVANRSRYDCIATLDLPALVASAARMREVLAQMEAFAAQVLRDEGYVWTADDVAGRVHRDARVVLKTVRAALEEKP
jgi:hypothetical protein